MNKAQEILNILEFEHSIWLNELNYGKTALSLFNNRLQQLYLNEGIDPDDAELSDLFLEIEQLNLAILFIKKEVTAHELRMNRTAKRNGDLQYLTDSNHQETKERMEFFAAHFQKVKEKFYSKLAIQG